MINVKPQAFIANYQNTLYRTIAADVSGLVVSEIKTTLPTAIINDGFHMYYSKWISIIQNPYSDASWSALFTEYYSRTEYRKLNQTTAGDPQIAKIATYSMLEKLMPELERYILRNIPKEAQADMLKTPLMALEYMKNTLTKEEYALQIDQLVNAMVNGASTDTEIAMGIIALRELGLYPQELGNIHQIRRIMSSRIVIQLRKLLKTYLTPAYGKLQVKETVKSGLPMGTKTMRSWSEMPDLLPTEMLNKQIMNYKIASKTANVRQRVSPNMDMVVYLDISQSMSKPIKFEGEYYNRIVVACASIIAMTVQLRQYHCQMTVIPFNNNLYGAITGFKSIMKYALTIYTSGGTYLDGVFKDVPLHPNHRIVIITDGEDTVSIKSLKAAGEQHAEMIILGDDTEKTINNFEKYIKCTKIKEVHGNILEV